jgi:hypothetical protein
MSEEGEAAESGRYEMEADTLSGDIRDVLLSHVRSMEVGWRFLSESQQRDKIYAMTSAATNLVRQAINIIATTEHPHITVAVGAVKIDKGVEIKLECPTSVDSITKLAEHGKRAAVLTLVDPETFFGEKDEAKPDPDQSELPVDEAA